MQDSPIQIGSISLQGFEVPASVRFGGRYRLAVHNLSGGRRAVERLGPDDGEITFSGTFSGPNAEARVQAFDNLRISGAIVWLTWKTFRRLVLVKNFVAEYHSPWWIPYKADCVVVHQNGATTAPASTQPTLISGDLANALSAVVGSTLSLTALQSALFKPNAMTIGTSDQVQATTVVGTLLDTINSEITLQSAAISAPIGLSADPSSFSRAFASKVNSCGLLAAAVNARSYVGRIGTSLSSAGT